MNEAQTAEALAWLDLEHSELLLTSYQRRMTTGYELAQAELDIAESTYGVARTEYDLNTLGRHEGPALNHCRARLALAYANLSKARAEFNIECDRLKLEVQRQALRVNYHAALHERASDRLDNPGF